jgi:hypothetical protein
MVESVGGEEGAGIGRGGGGGARRRRAALEVAGGADMALAALVFGGHTGKATTSPRGQKLEAAHMHHARGSFVRPVQSVRASFRLSLIWAWPNCASCRYDPNPRSPQ